MQEGDLRLGEIHSLGSYLIVQSQYVLIDERALQVEQRRERKHREGTLNYYSARENQQ